MSRRLHTSWMALHLALIVTILAAQAPPSTQPAPADNRHEFTELEVKRIMQHSPLPASPPLSATNRAAENPAALRLGHALFFDQRLSVNNAVSCATCHDPARAFMDGRPLGHGVHQLKRHTMSLWNVGYNRWYFWDGRADSLWSQALKPLEHPDEMATNRLAVLHYLQGNPARADDYRSAFGPMPDFSDVTRFPPNAGPIAANADWSREWAAMKAQDQATVNAAFANVGKAIGAHSASRQRW